MSHSYRDEVRETPRQQALRELREAEAETVGDFVSALFTWLLILAAFVSVWAWVSVQ